MPSKENEIAVDREMVNKYFSNTAIGDKISFQINGKSQDFVISGITESSTESQGNYSCYISKSFVENSSNYNPAKYQSYVLQRSGLLAVWEIQAISEKFFGRLSAARHVSTDTNGRITTPSDSIKILFLGCRRYNDSSRSARSVSAYQI